MTTAATLSARYVVADAYDTARAAGYLDLGNSRRRNAVRRLEREARDAARAEGIVFDALAVLLGQTLTRDELVAAFRREATSRVLRVERDGGYRDRRAAGVRNALRRAAQDLGDRFDELDDVEAPGDLIGDLEDILYGELGLDPAFERVAARGSAGGREVLA